MTRTIAAGESVLVAPALPLALLEAVRTSDRPGEVLEDEDLAISLPRRLGLTGVIDTQIRRYQSARRWQRSVPLDDVVNLLRLVLRRPDASGILLEAGRTLARMRYARTPPVAAGAWRILPRAASLAAVRRVTFRLLRSITGGARVEIEAPFDVRIWHDGIAQLDESGTACRLHTGVLEELVQLYTGRPAAVQHTRCMAMQQPVCEWSLAE